MRAYYLLLRLLPAAFRAEYESEMRAVFARRRRDTNVLWLWLEALTDVVTTAARVHADFLTQDLKYAARTLRRTPGFTITAVTVAALGIGATTAAVAMLDHVLLRPLPFRNASELVDLWHTERGSGRIEVSPSDWRDWKRMSTSFSAVEAYTRVSLNLVGRGDPERLTGAQVTGGLLSMLGVAPEIGRTFADADDRENAPGTVILSHGLWKSLFGGDPDVLGRSVVLDSQPFTVIGIMPASFHYPNRETEFWTTTRFQPDAFEDRTNYYLGGVARLKPGATIEQARAEMTVIAQQLAREFPKENANIGARVVPMRDELSEQSRTMVLALFGAGACVLLIACTNLANLLFARSLTRRREMAVRTALGAGRDRLRRQLLTESLVVAFAGSALGVAIAMASLPLVAKLVPVALPIGDVPSVDGRILAFAAALGIATALAFGVLPATRACKDTNPEILRESARGGAGARTERVRSMLVLAEVSACVVLLVSSGLLVRALLRVRSVDPGFRTDGVLTMRTSLPFPKYDATAQRQRFYDTVLADTRALPGVRSAAYISFLPMVMRGGIWKAKVPGSSQELAEVNVSVRFITPGFFDSMSIPIRSGRDVRDGDTREAPFVAVISESLARRYWPNENPIGKKLFVSFFDREVVGVAGDIRVRGLERTSEPQIYLPSKQIPDGWMPFYAPKDLVIRAGRDTASLVPAVREIIRRADPELPVSDVRFLSDIVASDTAARRVQLWALGALAALAFALAAIGIHGLMSYSVASRSQEVGIRMALGADRGRIVAMFLRQTGTLAALGVAIGVPVALWVARSLQALLAGVPATDPLTIVSAIALIALMSAMGSVVPAFRATRVDAAAAIRGD